MILNMANGPKLNGPFVPLAVGAYIMAWGTMGGPFEGASMNPARSFGPDVAIGEPVHLVGLPDRAGRSARSSPSAWRTCCAGRQGPGGQRRRGNAPGPGHHLTAGRRDGCDWCGGSQQS